MARRSSSVELLDLAHLVRGAEAVEEVEERNARFERGRLGDQGEVHGFLHGVGGQHARSRWRARPSRRCGRRRSKARGSPAARAATWNTVGVSSPAILYMLGIISSRPCDAVNVVASDPACKRAVHRAGRPALALHLDHGRHGAPDVRLAFCAHWSAHSPIGDDGVIG